MSISSAATFRACDTLKNYNPPVTTRVYASNGTVIGEYARERRIFVPIAFVPKLVIDAFVSAEDKNFYSHPGIDVGGILRAGVKDVYNVMTHRRLQGASTITQQVAKNFLLNSQVKFSPQDPRGDPGHPHRCDLSQGQDPRALPQ